MNSILFNGPALTLNFVCSKKKLLQQSGSMKKEYRALINGYKFIPYLYAPIVFSLQSHPGEYFPV
ncbi:hypothetical protein OM428_14095 [Enterococcus gallinarum]|nr:hypothetical protein [Enterococcus gallinarum]